MRFRLTLYVFGRLDFFFRIRDGKQGLHLGIDHLRELRFDFDIITDAFKTFLFRFNQTCVGSDLLRLPLLWLRSVHQILIILRGHIPVFLEVSHRVLQQAVHPLLLLLVYLPTLDRV